MGRGTTIRAALAATVLLAWPAGAQGQEADPAPLPPEPPTAETIHGQLDAALKAQPLVGVELDVEDSELGDMTNLKGVYDLQGKRFAGSMSFLFVKVSIYATPKRTLMRVFGTSCWEVDKTGETKLDFSQALLTSPVDLIDKTTLGPPVFSVLSGSEIKWTLGGKAPAEVIETYDPTTMLPIRQRIAIKMPKTKESAASTLEMNSDYTFTGVTLKAPKNAKICKTKKKKER
ncbi:MAG: hypothetical protein V9E83_04265 [Baekduia sp.]